MSAVIDKNTAAIDGNPAQQSSNLLIYRVATVSDCDSLAVLINSSFYGESSRHGWTNADALFSGQKTNANELSNMVNTDNRLILAFFGEADKILKGCVCLEHRPEVGTAYLGTLVVRPDLQGRNYGKFILSVAENYVVRNWNVERIEMSVIIQRPELVEYYLRRGYTDTGRREPVTVQRLKYAHAKRDDMEFCVLSKSMKKREQKIFE